MSQLMTVHEVADYLKVPATTLYRWRHHRTGPAVARVGRHLRYRREDVDRWVDEQRDVNANDGAPAA